MRRLILLLLLMSCASNTPKELTSVEIREYEGQRLDSVDDFRENSIKGPQKIDIDSYRLKITGLVEHEKEMTYDEVLSMPAYKKVIELFCVEGWSSKVLWEGVLVRELLDSAGVLPEANTVIFHAEDGYTTSFPLEYFQKDILMAYKMNDITLPAERGFPFHLVAEDKWGYKWIRWITRIELSSDSEYKGFWEKRGYNNDGSLDGPKFASR